MTKITIGYWKIRGLGQIPRLLLNYTGLEFEEVHHEDGQKWFAEEKNALGMDFPNLPYLIDGDFKLSESNAINRYIVTRSGKTELLGKNIHDQGLVENLLGVFSDVTKDLFALLFNPDHETAKVGYYEKVKAKIDYLKEFVGDKEFALGYLTLVDFYLAEFLNYFEVFFADKRKKYSFWWRIRKNFNSLPGIESYYQRKDAVSYPGLPLSAAKVNTHKRVRLGYWGIRGLGQVPRLLLSYSGVDFEDVHYTNPDKWFKEDKLNLGIDFPNLPYLIDGEYSISESSAVQKYIIRRYGKTELLGKNGQETARVESFLSIFQEISAAVKGLFWNPDHAVAKVALLEKYGPKLEQLDKYIGEKTTVLGFLSLADFVVAEDSIYIETIYPEEYKKWSFLHRITGNFNKLPEIVAFYETATAIKRPFFTPAALLRIPGDFPEEKKE